MRIEGAAYRSRPVSFDVIGPWTRPNTSEAQGSDPLVTLRQGVQIGVGVVALVLGAWLARRNRRAGRADARGAFLVGVSTGVPLIIGWLVGTHHTGEADAEWSRFTVQLAVALYWGGLFWLVYLAIEPYVRRRWPQALISWTRLVAGRFGDPLVGRDILIGCVGGIAIVLLGDVADALPGWLGWPPISPTGGNNALQSLGATGTFVAALVLRLTRVLSESLLVLFLLLVAHIALRNRWLANAAVTAMIIALGVNQEAVLFSSLFVIALVASIVILISRFGFLSYVAAMFVYFAVNDLPLTLDQSAWFAMRSAIVAAMLGAVAAWGFYKALAGRSAFGTIFE